MDVKSQIIRELGKGLIKPQPVIYSNTEAKKGSFDFAKALTEMSKISENAHNLTEQQVKAKETKIKKLATMPLLKDLLYGSHRS